MPLPDRYPKPGETCGVAASPFVIKRTALLFDRVYANTGWGDDVYLGIPWEITFGFEKADNNTEVAGNWAWRKLDKNGKLFTGKSFDELETELATYLSMTFIKAYQMEGIKVTPVYRIIPQFESIYPRGKSAVFQAALESIPIVKEDDLPWEQVMQFREDEEAVGNYRRLRKWIFDIQENTSIAQAKDIIDEKVELYSWALKKHGLKTVSGALTGVVAFVSGGKAAAFLGAPLDAIINTGILTIAGVSVWVANKLIDLRDLKIGQDSEIALIYDAKKRF